MSSQESREETYKRIKKRLGEYRYRSGFFTIASMSFSLLLILSVFPLVPVVIIGALRLSVTEWSVPLWFLCIGVFGALFWIFQKFSKMAEEKRGIVLEEKWYVPAYEALSFLKECSDPDHPIRGSKLKAIRRLRNLEYELGLVKFPYFSILREEVNQVWQLRDNLKYRLIPSVKNMERIGQKSTETINLTVTELVDYLSKPALAGLVSLNGKMASLPRITEKAIFEDLRSTILRRSNVRHVMAFSAISAIALLISYVDLGLPGASLHEAFIFGVGSAIALVTLYVTYLGLTSRRERRT